jgi:hypothetical protein
MLDLSHVIILGQGANKIGVPHFSIDNAHPNIFIAPFDVWITRICQLAVELGSTDRGRRNSSETRALLVVILSLMNNFLDLNSLMFNKY